MIIGALPAALLGTYVTGLPAWLHLPLCILVGAIAGGLWAMIVAVLKNRLRINEVILTIMMNYVATYIVDYLVNYPFRAEGKIIRTEEIQPTAAMTTLVPHTRLYSGIFLALAAAGILWYVLKKTIGKNICSVPCLSAVRWLVSEAQEKYLVFMATIFQI